MHGHSTFGSFMTKSNNPGRKPVKTIYEITVHLDDARDFVYRVDSESEVKEHLLSIATTGYMDCQPGRIELFPPHRIRSVVAYGADLNTKKPETIVE